MSVLSFGQRKYFADRYFEEFAYAKSAELYEGIYNKGDSTAFVLSRIGDSYYNNSDYSKAELWYEKLTKNYEEEILPEYLFKYSQTLKSNGKVAESDSWMLKFNGVKEYDSRPEGLKKNKDYFVDYSNKKTSYLNVNNISTNTAYSDFGGFIYKDALYFASSKPYSDKKKEKLYRWNNQPFLNVYKANEKALESSDAILDVEAAERVSEVNSKYHESNTIFTRDGNTMYFTRDNYNGKRLKKDEKNTVHLKLYRSEKIEESWSDAIELPFNSDEYSVGHPALSSDEKTLYFVSNMPNGYGLTDIYKVSVLEGKEYGEPENLGKPINTEGREMFPYLDKDDTMYFASNGHLGLGALDIFESKKEATNFSEPVNLGTPINSPLDDFAFVINETQTNGYFSSNRTGGKGDDDIYSFQLSSKVIPVVPEPEPEPTTCTQVISGTVRSSHDNSVLSDATVTLVDSKGVVIGEVLSNSEGAYSFDVLTCAIESYTLKGKKLDFRPDLKSFQTKEVTDKNNVTEIDLNLVLVPLIIGNQIVINPIYFDFDKSAIREDAKYELENIVTVMSNHPEMVIKIESHTDSRGSRNYNRYLSDRRAKSTRNYLYTRGIERARIQSAIGFGEDTLLNHCNDANRYKCTEEEHQLNRRSYFYIVSDTKKVKVQGQ